MSKPVLIVFEDDEREFRLLERDLESEYGERYRVLGATFGREALEKPRQLKNSKEPVALIVSDYDIPQMSCMPFGLMIGWRWGYCFDL